MSKIGKKPIIIPEGVEVELNDKVLEIKSSKGELSFKVLPYLRAELEEGKIIFSLENNSKQARMNWGTMRALAQNAVLGVKDGFEKKLEIEGVGYRVNMEGETLVLNLGYSHPVRFDAPSGIKITAVKNLIQVSGLNKDLVGRVAAVIRALKPVEPYKGKGIRYQGEVVKRKAGKKVAGTAK